MDYKHAAIVALATLPVGLSAADGVYIAAGGPAGFSGTHLIVGLIAGILLAIAFELVITNLSLAAGLSALGSGRARARAGNPEAGASGAGGASGASDGSGVAPQPRLTTLTNALGTWMVASTCIATFAASWLAVEISGAGNAFTGVVIGLVVWAAFLVLMVYWESLAVRSLLGAGFRLGAGGLRTLARAGRGLVSGSARSADRAAARDAIVAARRELFDLDDGRGVRRWLEDLVDKARTPQLDYARIRREIERILDDTGVASAAREGRVEDSELERIMPASGAGQGGSRGAWSDTVSRLVHQAVEALKKPKDDEGGGLVSRFAGSSFETGWARYLANAHRDELDPEAIMRELDLLVRDPRAGLRALRERLSSIDRESVAALLAQRQDLNEEEAHRVADHIIEAKDALLGRSEQVQNGLLTRIGEARGRIRDYLDRLGRDELGYDNLVEEFRLLFTDPKAGYAALRERLGRVDRGTIKAVLASRAGVGDEDAERMLGRLESARDEAWSRLERARDALGDKAGAAGEVARRAADDARCYASATAWWMFGAAAGSAACAAIAGSIAVNV